MNRLAILKLLYVYTRNEQISKYIVDEPVSHCWRKKLISKEKGKAKMKPMKFDWDQRYQYKCMVLYIYTHIQIDN